MNFAVVHRALLLYTPLYLISFLNSYNSIAKKLAILVESIKALMESAKDGYIVDETYETMIGNDIRYSELQERLEASNGDED